MKRRIIFCLLGGLLILSMNFMIGNNVYAQGENEPLDGGTLKEVVVTPQKGGTSESIGINLKDECLKGMGQGCIDYEKLVGIDKEQNANITATSIAQDVIFAATYMVGTILTLVIVYCGLMYIFAARDGKDVSKYRTGLINAAIGAILVWGAYAIVRLIQYIAKG